jgi:hypothetical protein
MLRLLRVIKEEPKLVIESFATMIVILGISPAMMYLTVTALAQ